MKQNRILSLILSLLIVQQFLAQNLTISAGGQTGTSGTNWSISGNVLTVAASGSATIDPSVITNHLSSIGSLTITLPAQASVTRDIYINNTISYTGSNARTLTINAANELIVASGVSITSSTAAMNLVLRSIFSAGVPDYGRIQLNGMTINTNGGHFWAGGGSGNSTWNGLTVGNNYSRTWTDNVAGISFIGSTLNTNGGSIYMAGLSYNTSDGLGENYGVNIRNSAITSGTGQIDILGDLKGMYGTGSGLAIFGNEGPVSISATSGAINLTGTGVDQAGTNTGWRRGLLLYTLSTSGISVTSTSGNISITGSAAFPANTNDDMIGIQLGSTQAITDGVKITSQTGNIIVSGSNTREVAGQNSNAVQFIAANVANSIRIGRDGTNPYSGNITIEGNSIFQNNVNAGSGSISVQSTGPLTIQPSGSAFTYLRSSTSGSLSFDNDWNFGTTLSGFTFGKSTNNLAISFSNDITLNGPFTAYGKNIGLLGISSNGDVYIRSTTYIDQTEGRTTFTNGGDVIYWAGGSGESYIRPATITTNGGHVFMGGDFDAVDTRVWHGHTVGGGYAFSATLACVSLRGNIDTRVSSNQSVGGDVLLAGESNTSALADVVAATVNRSISTGNGDITLMPYSEVLQNGGNSLQMVLSTTGRVAVAPVSGKTFWSGQTRTYNGSMSSNTFNGSSALVGLQILNFSSITGLEIGTYSGTGIVGDNTYTNSNIKDMTISSAFSLAGPITVYGGNIIVNGALTSTSASNIGLYATVDISQNSALTSQGGSVILWADRDGTSGGRIGSTANITTIGGHIYAGGGSSSELLNGLTVPSGYATSVTNTLSGISIAGSTINSAGGSIRMKGTNNSIDGTNAGLIVSTNSSISSGAGALALYGQRTGNPFQSAGLFLGTEITSGSATGNVSLSSTSGDIYLEGTTASLSNTYSWCHGFAIVANGGDDVSITSTTGNISMYGDGSNAATYAGEAVGFVIQSSSTTSLTNISTDGGSILINGKSSNVGVDLGSSFRAANAAGNITIGDANTGNLTLQFGSLSGNNNVGSVALQSAGAYVLEGNSAAAFGAAVEIPISYSFGSAGASLRIGSTNNNQDVTLSTAISINGPISVYGSNIVAQQNLTSSLTNAAILLQATGRVELSASRTIQTNNGNITLRANSGGTAVVLPNATTGAITLNSGSSLLSNGGNITLGGNFNGTEGTGLYAASNRTGGSPGILINNATITAAGGNINIYGKCVSSYDDGIRLQATITTTGSGNIGLYGDAFGGYNGTQYFGGITFFNEVSTVEAVNGTVTLEGVLTNSQSAEGYAINFYRSPGSAGQTKHIQILSRTGNIQITADRGSSIGGGIGHSSWGHVYFGTPSNNSYTATGAITFTYSGLVNAGSNGFKVKTTGPVTYEPVAASFIASQSLPANTHYVLADGTSSLTIGKTSNTATIDLTAAISVAGPITVYGGTINLNDDIASTSVPGGNITLSASNGFVTAGSVAIQRDITTSGGNILIEADSDANGSGQLDLDYLVLNPSSGNSIIRGETMVFSTASESIKPWINGTGTFTLESNDASFGQEVRMIWFRLNQDGNTLSGFNFGKSTNASNMYLNSVGGLTVNGPVNVNGAYIEFSAALTATNNNLSIRSSSSVAQTTPIIVSGLALNGTGTFTLTNTSNNFSTLAGGAIGTLIGATQIIDASGGLTIGTVGNNSGLTGSSTIQVETLAGNLTLTGNISTTSTSADAVIVTAAKNTAIGMPTGGDILVSGSPSIIMGTGGIAKLYSGYDLTSTGLTALAGGASNVRYNYDETSTTFNPTLSANNKYAIYRTGLGYGDLTIVSSGGDAEGSTWIYDNGVIKTTSGSANVLNTVVQSKLNAANLSIEANKIIFSANVTGSTNNTFSILSKTHIVNTNATTITTQGGNVLFASNVDDANDGETTTNGYIQLRFGITINSNGGNITFGGGNTSGSDYSMGTSAEDYTEGIRFDAVIALNSGGGNISLRGKSYARGVQWSYGASGVGLYFFSAATGTINSGTGTVTIDGFSQTHTSAYASGFYCMNNLTISSSNTTANAINITGKATGTSGEAWGIETDGIFSVLATGTGGGITVSSSQQNSGNNFDVVLRGETNILAASGPINLLGGQSGGLTNGTMFLGNNLFLGSKASSAVPASSSNLTIQYNLYNFSGFPARLASSGTLDWKPVSASFGQNVATDFFSWGQNGQSLSGLTIGKPGNAGNLYLNSTFTVAGPINAYGGYVEVTGAITSSGSGDIFLKGIANSNGSVNIGSGGITKVGGTGTLTLQANGRVASSGTISATGAGVLNVVMWSDFDGDNVGGGSTLSAGSISTNGGHVWMGGSNSNGGSYTWNGLSVGDGPSVGASGANSHALDMFGPITTNGGDLLLWAGTGSGGANGIVANAGWQLNVGGGDIVLITNVVLGVNGVPLFFRQTGGTFTMVPNGSSFPSVVNWYPDFGTYGAMAGWNFIGDFEYLWIDNPSALTNLTIGRYDGMTNGGVPVVFTNSSNINFNLPTTIAGSMSFYGGALALSSNLTTTNTTIGNILLSGTTISGIGNIAPAAGRTATINVSSNSTYDGIVSGSGSGLTKLGAGMLTLTKDHTYSGPTVISAGDLQVGTGGSVSQASSGTVSNTSGVTIASNSKFILAPNENIVFAAPISGAGGVEIKGASGAYYNSFLTGTAATIAANSTVLEVLTRITGGLQAGQAVNGGGTQTAGAYVKSYSAATNTATLQFQQYDGSFTKCVFAKLSQSGTSVMIQANTAFYNGAAYRNVNSLGADMSTGSTLMGLATSSGPGTGYGINQVYLSGKVNFTGSLTYTGNTLLSNTITNGAAGNVYSYTSKGTQEITDASSSFPSTSTVINNGLVIFNRATPLTISSDMEGTEEVLQVGAAISLTGANTHSGNTTIDLNKSLVIGSGATIGSITGNIINYGTLTFNRSDSSSYTGIISGSGALVKSGVDAFTLTGLNTYTGATTINGGRLILQRDVPATSSSSYSGAGKLVIQPNSNSFTSSVIYPIPGFTISSSIGGLTIGKPTNTASVSFTSSTTTAGTITAYGGAITVSAALSAAGDILLDGDNGSFLSQNTKGVEINAAVTTTNNGNITIHGRGGSGNAQFGNFGVQIAQTVEAGGSGTITVTGIGGLSSNGPSGSSHGVNLDGSSAWIKSNGGNVTVTGNGGGANSGTYSQGVVMLNSSRISAGGSGILTITGTGGVNTIIGLRGVVINSGSSVFTAGGAININGYHGTNGSDNSDGVAMDNATVGSNTSGPITIVGTAGGGTGSEAISMSSTITIGGASHANNIVLRGNTMALAGTNAVLTTGQVTIEPYGDSFSSGLTFPISSLSIANTITGLTLGKATNTANITFANATTVNGPITVYGGTVALNENISSSASGTISLYANALTIASDKTVTSGGQLIISPQNTSTTIGIAGASGTLALPLTYFSTNFTDGFSNIQIGRNEHTEAISSNAFTLLDNMTFLTSGSLTLGGKPLMGNNNVTLGSAISSISASISGYFQTNGSGKVFRNVSHASTLQFPVGNSSYNPVSIKNNSGSADNFSVRVLDVIENNSNLSAIKHVYRTWDIGKTTSNAGAGIDVTFNWNAGEIMNGPLVNPILHHYGAYWETAIGSSTAAAGSPILSLTHTGYTGTFSPFAISDASTPLPVSMVFFNLNCSKDNVELNWQTASEHNSDYFQLETSLDAVNWEIVQTISAAGFSQELLNYSAEDQDAARNQKYYRLKQVDFNGEFALYGPLKADCAVETTNISLHPNPCESQVVLSIDTQIPTEISYTIANPEGLVLETKKMAVQSGITLYTLDVSDYPSGIYIIQFELNEKRFIKKLTVQ